MNAAELKALLAGGEGSTVEFKRDDVANHDLAKALVAFLNVEGGSVLLGVEDDGAVAGSTRRRLEGWASEACRAKIDPPVIPLLAWSRDAAPGKDVLVVQVPQGPDKPYARVHNDRRTYYVRVGATSREASREELERMFQASGRLRYGLKPVPGADLTALDMRRLRDYFSRVTGGEAPAETDVRAWETLLGNVDLGTVAQGRPVATVDGLLLFGEDPSRFVRQSGIRAVCYADCSRATRPAPTRTCAAPCCRLVPQTAVSWRLGWWSRLGTSCGATPRRRRASRAAAESTAGNTRKRCFAK